MTGGGASDGLEGDREGFVFEAGGGGVGREDEDG